MTESVLENTQSNTLPPPPVQAGETNLDFFDDNRTIESQDENSRHLDKDSDLWFQLQGDSINPLLDLATPLFGLAMRLKRITTYDDKSIESLFFQIRDTLVRVLAQTRQLGYDDASQLAFSYALCAYVDESVMSTPWGSYSIWNKQPLLSLFHNETWSGEKFFTILSRMLLEPDKYQDMLETIYYSIALGFRGKYASQANGEAELSEIMRKLHRVLRDLRGDSPEYLIDTTQNVAATNYGLKRSVPLWIVWAGALALLSSVYLYFAIDLNTTTHEIINSLDQILNK